jgi:broad specificity phosphatase PhoE
MLITGTDIQPEGRKTVYEYEQAWWREAPPRPEPFADVVERRRRAVEAHAAFEQYLADM